jgi:hypothetical protein
MKKLLFMIIVYSTIGIAQNYYVGSEQCGECHEEIYNNFLKHSPKAKSYASILKLKDRLSLSEFNNCLKCHTTGYGEKTGFKSVNETPKLKNLSCETCHGQGGKHSETENPAHIQKIPSQNNCDKCHKEGYGKKQITIAGAH